MGKTTFEEPEFWDVVGRNLEEEIRKIVREELVKTIKEDNLKRLKAEYDRALLRTSAIINGQLKR